MPRSRTQEKIDATRKAVESDDLEKIKAATDALNQHIQTLGGSMYQQGASEPAPGAADPNAGQQQKPGGEDVVEGEYTEA